LSSGFLNIHDDPVQRSDHEFGGTPTRCGLRSQRCRQSHRRAKEQKEQRGKKNLEESNSS